MALKNNDKNFPDGDTENGSAVKDPKTRVEKNKLAMAHSAKKNSCKNCDGLCCRKKTSAGNHQGDVEEPLILL